MRPLLPLILLLLPGVPLQDSQPIDVNVWDTETGELTASLNGVGDKFNHETGTGTARRMNITLHTKPTSRDPVSHKIRLFAARCELEGVVPEGGGKGTVRFSEQLRVFIDDKVRMWTEEGTLDIHKQVLKCPKTTHLVQYEWPPTFDLASALVFMDPQEMGWLRRFGAPEPDFELVGDEFEFDAAANVFTAGKNGRLRVVGRPGAAVLPGKKPSRRKKPMEPTELRSDGPLRLQNLGPGSDGWNTLHITAERNVVIVRRSKGVVTRSSGDKASIYLALPPENQKSGPRVLAAALTGSVRIDQESGFTATADRLEWNHQEGLVRLAGAPRVEVVQGPQRLQAREAIIDQVNRTVDFKGDIEATFLPSRPETGATGATITMKPGALRLQTDSSGRPASVTAWNGVRLSTPLDAASGDALEAEGRRFEWDFATGEGALRGAPFARIEQGANLVVAPLITFHGDSFSESLMVIKGPKVLRFFIENKPPLHVGAATMNAAIGLPGFRPPPREPTLHASARLLEASLGLPGMQRIPGRREATTDLVITCDGDAAVDRKAGLVKLVDRCEVRAQDSTLTADRLFVYLTENGTRFERVIGLGGVRAYQSQGPRGDSFQIEGEVLELRQEPVHDQKIVTVVGLPTGRGRLGDREFRFGRMTYNLNEKTFQIWEMKGMAFKLTESR